ncbi:MAG: Ig-like domain-containing protein, partial [Bacteroidota bacterium]
MNQFKLTTSVAIGWLCVGICAAQPSVQEISPTHLSTGISPSATVRIDFDESIEPATITLDGIRILKDGAVVPATLNSDLSNSAITITPERPFEELVLYVVEVTTDLIGISGASATPYFSSFVTGITEPEPQIGFRFNRSLIDEETACTSLDVGPDGHLYVAFVDGRIKRYVLDPATGLATSTEVLVDLQKQIITLIFDPEATTENLQIWVSYATCTGDTDNFTGVISRLTLLPAGEPGEAEETIFITGLPHSNFCEHQPNGLQFSPEGILYQTVGGVATFGKANWGADESLLSAALIYMDVKNDPAFLEVNLPVNVKVDEPVNYDPYAPDAPVKIYATGFRNMLGVVFHSNGSIYGATNQNSTNQFSEACGDVPAINAKPREMLFNIKKDKYYGHQNLSRGECVHNGGNPTPGADPFEITAYPVGTQPEPNFDPSLIYDIRSGGGRSANGMDEFEGPGTLNGRLLVAYFTGSKVIQTFEFDEDGQVIDERPLVNGNNQAIRFTGALDVVHHPMTNRVYVADFGIQSTFQGGSVFLLDPITSEPPQLGSGIFQAEENSRSQGVNDAFRFDGYTGSGYIDFGGKGSYIQWENVDGENGGTAEVTFRYANGSNVNRTCEVLVDGMIAGTLDFPPVETGNWSAWTTTRLTLELGENANTIRLQASTSRGGPNVDFMEVDAPSSLENLTPRVALLKPADGSIAEEGDEVTLQGTAIDIDGSIARMAFFIQDELVAEATEAPYEFATILDNPGTLDIYVVAYDNQSASDTSHVAVIEVQSKSIPTEGVSLLPESAKVSSGDTLQFTATVIPQDATNRALNGSSSDPDLGIIQQDGLFIATASGTALEAHLTINEDTLALTLGEELQLQASGHCISSVIVSAQTVVSVST